MEGYNMNIKNLETKVEKNLRKLNIIISINIFITFVFLILSFTHYKINNMSNSLIFSIIATFMLGILMIILKKKQNILK